MKRTSMYLVVIPALFLFVFSMALSAYAADPSSFPIGKLDVSNIGGGGGSEGKDYAGVDDLTDLIISGINWFAWAISVAAVVMGLYSGILFITARGETMQLGTAKKTLLYAVIGVAVSVVSFSIIAITKAFL